MNAKTAKLLRKFVKNATGLEGDRLDHAVKTAKTQYIKSLKPNRDAIKTVMRSK